MFESIFNKIYIKTKNEKLSLYVTKIIYSIIRVIFLIFYNLKR